MLQAKPLYKSLFAAIIPVALILLGALLLLLGPMVPAQAQDARVARKLLQTTVLSVEPASAEMGVGVTTTVDIRIADVTDLAYAEMYVLFDPDLLEVVDADSATSGVQIEIGPFLGTDVTVYDNDVDQDLGQIYFAQQVASNAVDGSGVLAQITFEGRAPGTSDITIYEETDELYVDDSNEEPIDVSVENGSITVTEDVTPSSTPEGTSTSTLEATATSTATLAATSTAGATSTESAETSTPTRTPTPGPTSEPTVRPTATSEVKARVLEVWPDRSVGVISELLEGTTSYASTQVLPFGVVSTSAGELVEARTYLHFPIRVFPLGTQVKRATLYAYVDSASGREGAAFGMYRVLDSWDATGWDGDPANWPTLLPAPIAITEVDFAAEEAMLPVSSVPKLAMLLAQDSPLSTPTAPSSVLATSTPPATSSPGSTSTPKATTQPPASASTLELEPTEGRWLMWDVTALLRAWLAQEVPDHGLALAAVDDSSVESTGELILARLFTADDPDTMSHIIADIEIYPVTPTPTPTPVPILPIAGDSGSGGGIGVVVIGAALMILGLALAAWQGRSTDRAK
jgi:uncharacterized membrane protein